MANFKTTSYKKVIWKWLKPVRINTYPAAEVAYKCFLDITSFLFTTDKRAAIIENSLVNWRTQNFFHNFCLWIELKKLSVRIREHRQVRSKLQYKYLNRFLS